MNLSTGLEDSQKTEKQKRMFCLDCIYFHTLGCNTLGCGGAWFILRSHLHTPARGVGCLIIGWLFYPSYLHTPSSTPPGTEGHSSMQVTFPLKINSKFLSCLSGDKIDRDWKPYAV